MSATSIKLISSNLDADLVSAIPGLRARTTKGHPPSWELVLDDLPYPNVEELLLRWASVLEEIKARVGDPEGYLQVRVYENDFSISDDLLSRLGAVGIELSVWFKPPEPREWKEPEHVAQITFTEPTFYSELDEDQFFRWLHAIDGVMEVRGHLSNLTVYLSNNRLSHPGLREFLGLLHRYRISTSALGSQMTPENAHLFEDS